MHILIFEVTMQKKIPVADAHCDFLYGMVNRKYDINTLSDRQTIFLPYLAGGGVALQFFAAWVDTKLRKTYIEQCLDMFDAFYRMIDDNDAVVPMDKDFKPESGKIAAVLTVEGGEAINGNLSVLRMFYKLGVRAMSLTWNTVNELASPAVRRGHKGLTALGRKVVREMCRLGMAVDVSHLNDAGIDDVLSVASRPVFASHSNARRICDHPRSLSDRQIKAIAGNNGVMCVNFYHLQLCGRKTATIDDVIRHIDHFVQTGGIDCVGFGSDFDGMNTYPEGIENSAAYPDILNALLKSGYSEEEVRKIAFDNLYRYIVQFY
ncbi:MAG: Membrane dipeptidase (Peptidase family M19) [Firmicutes bacterium ADurb.Bin182]|nr:MAG: Membrane dipeptidase (Peptidase family M19) [Firmicutes bacterium ADurb.Bin182]